MVHTTPLNAGILGAASPIFVALASWIALGDRLTGRNWLGIALSVLAVLVTVAKGSLGVLPVTLGHLWYYRSRAPSAPRVQRPC